MAGAAECCEKAYPRGFGGERVADSSKSYKTLIINTVTFAIGSFGSKLLVLILVPLYTAALSPAEYGTVDLIAQTANVLIPIFTLTISEAALRFGLDAVSEEQRKEVYTVCLRVLFVGLIVMAGVFPFLSRLDYLDGELIILYIYVWTSSLRQLNMTFVRALKRVRLFAADGVLCTLAMLLLNILFLLGFRWGITGYLLAIIFSDAFSAVFLFIAGRLWRYIGVRRSDASLVRDMIRYAVPMVPSMVLWLVTSVSDRFVLKYFHGEYLNGILAIAYKIPAILNTVFTMFSQAWNMSAISEDKSEGRDSFYSTVFDLNQSFMYVLSAGILLFIKPITYVWVDGEYFSSYKYAAILIIATVFTCFNVFLGSVYIAQKKTKHTFYTSLAAGLINIVLNFLLIPRYEIYGAAIATFIAYFAVFFYRLFDSRRYIPFSFRMSKILTNTLLLCGMAALNQLEASAVIQYASLGALFILVVILNIKELLRTAIFLIPKKLRARIGIIGRLEQKLNENKTTEE